MTSLARALRSCARSLALVVLTVGPAGATTFVIDNGSAPPDPANVISAVAPGDEYEVRDAPGGASTAVAVVDPAEFGWLRVYDASSVSLEGGTGQVVSAGDQSSIVIDGGIVNFISITDQASLVLESGGHRLGPDSYFSVFGDATATILGGIVADSGLDVGERGHVAIFGGQFLTLDGDPPGRWTIGGEGVVTVHGSGFAVDGVPVAIGPVTVPGGRLTGILESGEPLDVAFGVGASATLLLVPEPSLALLLAGGLGWLAVSRARGRAAA